METPAVLKLIDSLKYYVICNRKLTALKLSYEHIRQIYFILDKYDQISVESKGLNPLIIEQTGEMLAHIRSQ
jgi:hypothetical protein